LLIKHEQFAQGRMSEFHQKYIEEELP